MKTIRYRRVYPILLAKASDALDRIKAAPLDNEVAKFYLELARAGSDSEEIVLRVAMHELEDAIYRDAYDVLLARLQDLLATVQNHSFNTEAAEIVEELRREETV